MTVSSEMYFSAFCQKQKLKIFIRLNSFYSNIFINNLYAELNALLNGISCNFFIIKICVTEAKINNQSLLQQVYVLHINTTYNLHQ